MHDYKLLIAVQLWSNCPLCVYVTANTCLGSLKGKQLQPSLTGKSIFFFCQPASHTTILQYRLHSLSISAALECRTVARNHLLIQGKTGARPSAFDVSNSLKLLKNIFFTFHKNRQKFCFQTLLRQKHNRGYVVNIICAYCIYDANFKEKFTGKKKKDSVMIYLCCFKHVCCYF